MPLPSSHFLLLCFTWLTAELVHLNSFLSPGGWAFPSLSAQVVAGRKRKHRKESKSLVKARDLSEPQFLPVKYGLNTCFAWVLWGLEVLLLRCLAELPRNRRWSQNFYCCHSYCCALIPGALASQVRLHWVLFHCSPTYREIWLWRSQPEGGIAFCRGWINLSAVAFAQGEPVCWRKASPCWLTGGLPSLVVWVFSFSGWDAFIVRIHDRLCWGRKTGIPPQFSSGY